MELDSNHNGRVKLIPPEPECNPKIKLLLANYTLSEFIAAIQVTLVELKIRRDMIKQLVSKLIEKASTKCWPSDVIGLITARDTELIPELAKIIQRDITNDKYWYDNLITLLTAELVKAHDIWELADGEFNGIFEEWENKYHQDIDEFILIWGQTCVSDIPVKSIIGGPIRKDILSKLTGIYHESIINAIQKNIIHIPPD